MEIKSRKHGDVRCAVDCLGRLFKGQGRGGTTRTTHRTTRSSPNVTSSVSPLEHFNTFQWILCPRPKPHLAMQCPMAWAAPPLSRKHPWGWGETALPLDTHWTSKELNGADQQPPMGNPQTVLPSAPRARRIKRAPLATSSTASPGT